MPGGLLGNGGYTFVSGGSSYEDSDFLLGFFGTGEDGSATITGGTTTLTINKSYTDLTVASTGILKPDGCRIFVSGTLTIASGGQITFPGNNASGSSGGSAQSLASVRTLRPLCNAGANAGTGAGSTANGGRYTGDGGAGGNGDGGSGGGTNSATYQTKGGTMYSGGMLLTGNPSPAYTVDEQWSSSGGSSGGGSGSDVGGGGGGGAGLIWICARYINITGANAITAPGGAGADGNGLGNTGGGGGGSGGGVVLLYRKNLGPAITAGTEISAPGGAGGAGQGTGTNGAAGGDGVVVISRL